MKKKENRKGAGRKVATEDVIELDFKADIVAAAEALRRSPQTKVILVLPKEPAEFRKLANLKLLARIGAVLNRQAVLATDDRLVVRLAAGLKLETRPPARRAGRVRLQLRRLPARATGLQIRSAPARRGCRARPRSDPPVLNRVDRFLGDRRWRFGGGLLPLAATSRYYR